MRDLQAEIQVVWLYANVGPDHTTLMATVSGNPNELPGIKLFELDLPDIFIEAFPGPRFGVAGWRERFGFDKVPTIGTIIKPSIGFLSEEAAEAVAQFAESKIDFIIYNELNANPLYAPPEAARDNSSAGDRNLCAASAGAEAGCGSAATGKPVNGLDKEWQIAWKARRL